MKIFTIFSKEFNHHWGIYILKKDIILFSKLNMLKFLKNQNQLVIKGEENSILIADDIYLKCLL